MLLFITMTVNIYKTISHLEWKITIYICITYIMHHHCDFNWFYTYKLFFVTNNDNGIADQVIMKDNLTEFCLQNNCQKLTLS